MIKLDSKSVLIVEKDLAFQNSLKNMFKAIGFKKIETAINYEQALNSFLSFSPDIALIDIDLESTRTGIDIAHSFNAYGRIPFVFITSNYSEAEYEIAKEAGPIAFTNKNISALDLRQIVELGLHQCISNSKLKEIPLKTNLFSEEIFIKIGNVLKRIFLKDIDWFGVDGKYAYLKKENKQLPLNIYLKELGQLIPSDLFVRIHQSYIINIKKIESINTVKGIVNIQNEEIPIGRSYKKKFLKRINYL